MRSKSFSTTGLRCQQVGWACFAVLALTVGPTFEAHAQSCVAFGQINCDVQPQCAWLATVGLCSCANSVEQDVIFLLDGSGSVGSTGWALQRQFVADLVTTGLDPNSRVGIIRYATGAETVWTFADSQDRNDIATALNGLSYPAGQSYTRTAVQQALDDFQAYGDTRPRLLFLITDGSPSPTSEDPCPLASALAADGIKTVVLGASPSFSPATYSCLVVDSVTQIIAVSSFGALEAARDDTDAHTCPVVGTVAVEQVPWSLVKTLHRE